MSFKVTSSIIEMIMYRVLFRVSTDALCPCVFMFDVLFFDILIIETKHLMLLTFGPSMFHLIFNRDFRISIYDKMFWCVQLKVKCLENKRMIISVPLECLWKTVIPIFSLQTTTQNA